MGHVWHLISFEEFMYAIFFGFETTEMFRDDCFVIDRGTHFLKQGVIKLNVLNYYCGDMCLFYDM